MNVAGSGRARSCTVVSTTVAPAASASPASSSSDASAAARRADPLTTPTSAARSTAGVDVRLLVIKWDAQDRNISEAPLWKTCRFAPLRQYLGARPPGGRLDDPADASTSHQNPTTREAARAAAASDRWRPRGHEQ